MNNIIKKKLIIILIINIFFNLNICYSNNVIDTTNTNIINDEIDFFTNDNEEWTKENLYKNISVVMQDAINTNISFYNSTLSNAAYNNMYQTLEPYTKEDTKEILNYILEEPYKKIFARYRINKNALIFYSPIKLVNKEKLLYNEENYFSNLSNIISTIIPQEDLVNIKYIYFETSGEKINKKNNEEKQVVKLIPLDNKKQIFNIHIDIINIVDENELKKEIIKEYIYYKFINYNQIEKEKMSSFSFEGNIYKKLSYINLFYKQFWINELSRRKHFYNKMMDEQMLTNNYSLIYENNYEAKDTDFVNKKAQESIFDDIKETFLEFVLSNKRPYNNFKDYKINFFYDFDEFVKLKRKYELLKLK